MIGKQNYYHCHSKKATQINMKSESSSLSTSISSDPDSNDHTTNETKLTQNAPNRNIPSDRQNRYKLKVELCKNYSLNKSCPYESNCRFAHGLEELL
jgi:hypothetical protein